jgi:hypothetical protein
MSWNSTDTKEIRKFGSVALIFFGCLCALGVWKQKVVPTYLFGFLSALGVGFILIPKPLRPFYAGWLKIAHLVGRTVTTLILTLAFYLVITPLALVKRLFGGRPLPVRPDKEVETYWVSRDIPAQHKEQFIKRY